MNKRYVSIVNKDPFVILYYRDETNILKFEKKKVLWYFGIRKIDAERPIIKMKIRQLMVNSDRNQKIYKTEIKGDYCLIYCSRFSSVPFILKQFKIQTFEDDLSLARRFWLDSKLNIASEYKIAFFDIETDDSTILEIGKDTILSFAIKDLEGVEYFYSLKDFGMSEKKLLEKFIEIIDQYDLISGWNSWGFDIPYLKTRMLLKGVQWLNERRLSHIDLQQRMIHSYRFDSRIRSYSLDYIAKRFLKEGKIVRSAKIIDLFKNNLSELQEYNLNDVRLLYKLEIKNHILSVLIKQAMWCNTFPNEISPSGKSIYRLLDNLILKIAHQDRKMLFSPKFSRDQMKRMTEEELKKFEYPGGYVMTPVCGCYNNVYNFDFISLYPSIIRTWNIGLDTRISNPQFDAAKLNKNPEGSYYLKEPKSIISTVLDLVLEKRKKYKQIILKMVEEGKIGTPEYEVAHADEVVVKELSNCVHPLTLLTVYDTTENKYNTLTIKEIYNISLNHKLYIQSYNFKTRKVEWDKISKVFKKEHNGVLKRLIFYHSNNLYCTPEHRLLGFNFPNILNNRSPKNRIICKSRYKYLDLNKQLQTQEVKEIPVFKYNNKTITLAKANSVFKTDDIDYLDIREYSLKSIFQVQFSNLNIFYNQIRKKKMQTIKTTNQEFNNYIFFKTHKKIKGCRNMLKTQVSNQKYRVSVPLDQKLWNLLKKVSKEDVLKYDMSVTLSRSRRTCPILFKLSLDLLWSIGLWVAEGCANYSNKKHVSGGISIANTNEQYNQKFYECFINLKLNSAIRKKNGVNVPMTILGEMFINDFYLNLSNLDIKIPQKTDHIRTLHNSYNKKIPNWIYRLPKNYIKEFINGYHAGDGDKKCNRITTVSKHLAYQISDLISYCYQEPVKIHDYSNEIKKEYGYRIRYNKGIHKKKTTYFERFHNDITYETLNKSQDILYNGEVYDLETQSNHNFFIGNILSHNSLYGICGRRDGRYFSKELASSITLAGQWLVKSLNRFAELKKDVPIYADTDSLVMTTLNQNFDIKEFLVQFHQWLKEELKKEWNIDTSYIVLEFDRYYKRYILVDKKNYTGWVLSQEHKKTNYIYTRGLEVVKSSTCLLASQSQEELIIKLLKEDNTLDYYQKWVLNKREHIFDNVTKEDLTLTTKVNKAFSKYKNKTLPVLLAEKKLKKEGMLLTRDIHYIITKTNPKLEGIESEEWTGEFDKTYYWDRTVLSSLNRLLKTVFPQIDWKKQYCYENMFDTQLKLF